MATSGTWAFDLDVGEIIDEAFGRLGKEPRTGYDFRTARRSLDLLLLEWQNRGLNLWTVKQASQALTAGTASYTLSGEKLDIIDGLLRTNAGDTSSQTDLFMRRISVDTYARKSNKLTTGKPIQYWIQRAPEAITVHLWPVPDAAESYTFNYYYMERVEDSGKPASNNIDVPARFLPALVSGLAHSLAMKHPDTMQMAPMLEAAYEKQFSLAADSAREKASWMMRPKVGA